MGDSNKTVCCCGSVIGLVIIVVFLKVFFAMGLQEDRFRPIVIIGGGVLIFIIGFAIYDDFKKTQNNGTYNYKTQKQKNEETIRESNIDGLSGPKFEQYIEILYSDIGYNVTRTKPGRDQGADLILSKNGQKIVIQCKRYSQNVGNKAVQEVVASKAYYGATEAWIVTNSYFTQSAIDLAHANRVTLICRDKLIDKINERKNSYEEN